MIKNSRKTIEDVDQRENSAYGKKQLGKST